MADSPPRRRANRTRQAPNGQSSGPGVDAQGRAVFDPTANVLRLIELEIERQDDLRNQESGHFREIMAVRSGYEHRITSMMTTYERQLQEQEAARIDAIRAVDVAAGERAAVVSTTQAGILAAQVAAAAEAMRVQVAAAASAAQANLTAALEPIQTAISDLRRVQYEQQGQRSAQSEGKETSQWVVVLVVGMVVAVIQIALHFVK
jgi:hypothetical protein